MTTKLYKKFALGLCLLALISGCSQHQSSKSLRFSPPLSFTEIGQQNLSAKWWQDFNDPELNSLIQTALSGNFSLQAAYNRLQQVRATYGVQRADRLPQIDGQGSAETNSSEIDDTKTTSETYLLGLTASYELDLWGRVKSLSEAARLQAVASEQDLITAAISLSAEVATNWYSLVEKRARLNIIEKQIATNIKGREIIALQFRTGQVAIADLLQQKQLIEASKAEHTKLEEQIRLNIFRLNILLGFSPTHTGAISNTATLIDLPDLPQTGIPIKFLQKRPDLQASLLRIQAEDQELAAAIAARYPKISISAGLNTNGSSTSDLFHDWLSSLAANITAPIFDAGKISSQIDQQKAVIAEQVNDYNTDALNALSEVESALATESAQTKYLAQITRQYQLSTSAMQQIKNRYLKGSENYQRVLTALVSMQGLEQNTVSAKADIITTRIELCRALAGGWDIDFTGDNHDGK